MPWLDQTGTIDLDLFGTTEPAFVDGPAGPWLDFDGVDQYASGGTAGDLATEFQGLWTLEFWARIRAYGSPYLVVYGEGVVTGGLAADNSQLFVTVGNVGNNKELVVGWESFGVLRRFETGIKIELDQPYLIQIRKIAINADYGVEVFINGGLAYQTQSGDELANAAGGANAVWNVGGGATGTGYTNGNIGPMAFYTEQRTDEELADTWRRAMRYDVATAQCARVDVQDGNGDWVNIDELPGGPWVKSVEYGEARSNTGKSATIKTAREEGEHSLSPLVTSSRLNWIPRDETGTYDPFFDLRRGLRIYAARVPVDSVPASTDWELVFDGEITNINSGGRNDVVIGARDNGAALQSSFIRDEIDYSVGTTTPMETVMQSILDDNVGGITLEVPQDPNADVTEFTQRREPVLTALKNLARRIGWDVRWVWSPTHEEFRLTLQEINRENPVPGGVLGPNDYVLMSSFKLDVSKIRTNGEVVYPSTETVDPAYVPPTGYTGTHDWYGQDETGEPLGTVLRLEHTDAAFRYGSDLFFSCIESESSLINTAPEAERFLVAMLDDMGTPDVDANVSLSHVAFEIGLDFLRLLPDGVHADDAQQFSVMQYRHSFDMSGGGKTSLALRGKPSLGADSWLSIDARGGVLPSVTVPVQFMAGRPPGERLQSRLDLIEGSDANVSKGRRTSTPNANFGMLQSGPRFPPTSWSLQASGTWGVNWSHETATANVVTAGRAVKVENDAFGERLSNSFIECTEGDLLEMEVTWKGARPQAFCLFYDENRTVLPGIYPNPAWIPVATVGGNLANGYTRSIYRAITVPINARFVSIAVANSPLHSGTNYFDAVEVRSMPRSALSTLSVNTGNFAPGPTWHTIVWDVETWDHGNNMAGSTFTCQKSGRYSLASMVQLEHILGILVEPNSLGCRFLRNGSQIIGQTSSDILEVGGASETIARVTSAATLWLDEGDTITVQVFINGGTFNFYAATESYFSVEEQLEG